MIVIFSNWCRIYSLYTYIHVHKYVSCINYAPTQVKSWLCHCPYKALLHTVHMLKTIHIELFLSLSRVFVFKRLSRVFFSAQATYQTLLKTSYVSPARQSLFIWIMHFTVFFFFFDSDILFQALYGDSQFIQ